MKGCQQQTERRRSKRAKGEMYFTEKQGNTLTRANAVRPLDVTIRAYWLATAVSFFSLGGLPCLPFIMPFLFLPEERIPATNDLSWFVWSIVFLTLCILSAGIYLLDCIHRWVLSTISISQLRQRLAKSEKSARYVAKPSHLRGERIGAWFFGILSVVYLIVMVTRWLARGCP